MRSNPPENFPAIRIHGARTHNLQAIDVDLPRNRLVVLTGVSGSGKSSLAIDTIFAEGQRRFLESLTSAERKALGQLPRPDVDVIQSLPPTVCIDQRSRPADRRSTLSTLTGTADFLRILFARMGQAHCPDCGREVSCQSSQAIIQQILRLEDRKKVMILAPWVRGRKGEHRQAFEEINKAGFVRARVDGEVVDVTDPPELAKTQRHEIEAVVDRILVKDGIEDRLRESVDLALKHGEGTCLISWLDGETWTDRLYSERFACPECEQSFPALEPRSFSFNSPYGACPDCNGLGVVAENDDPTSERTCTTCHGERLNAFSRAVTFAGMSWGGLQQLPISQCLGKIASLTNREDHADHAIGKRIVPEIERRLKFLMRVELAYLSLNRPAKTLSGGEFQRARLAACLGTGLRGVCFVLDEPTAGLHPVNTEKLLTVLEELRDGGNTVVVVEHDLECMRTADWLVDLGPGAGIHGGEIVAAGTPEDIENTTDSVTGQFLRGEAAPRRTKSNDEPSQFLELTGANRNNLKNVTLRIPLGRLTCVNGVSGSGKSTLISETLVPAMKTAIHEKKIVSSADFSSVSGWEHFESVLEIDQSPLGRSRQSTPATYSGIWDEVRKLFAKTKESRLRGFTAKRFSFNSREGRCPECQGRGTLQIEMHFLPDVAITCPHCSGHRFNRQTLAVQFRGQTVAEVLEMTMSAAREFFRNFARLESALGVFEAVGLGYLKLGQSAETLSGGERQRVKLASELAKPKPGHTLYVLDEPTLGLHPADVGRLIGLLDQLVSEGNTVVVVEHHTSLMRCADWLIDLGPGGGDEGGHIVVEGPLETILAAENSLTGQTLRRRDDSLTE